MTKRLVIAKLLAVSVVGAAFVSQQYYKEDSAIEISFELTGMALLGAAALGRVWSAVFVSGRKSQELITDGPFSITRNPLYFFSFLGFLGAGLLFQSFIITAALVAIFFLTHWPTILKEEVKLRGIFGEKYDDYCMAVPRFIPRPWLYNSRATAEFCPRVFTKAVFESMLMLSLIPLADGLEHLRTSTLTPALFILY